MDDIGHRPGSGRGPDAAGRYVRSGPYETDELTLWSDPDCVKGHIFTVMTRRADMEDESTEGR